MKIDAHQHFWQLSRGDYGWLTPALGPIYRDFMPHDLEPLLAAAGIGRTILVQAAATEAETLFLLETARKTAFVAGVIGWVDMAGETALARIASLAENRLLIGVRPMVQDIADDDWLLLPQLDAAFAALQEQDLVFDALTLPRHLARLLVVAKRHPHLAIVIDHASKPNFREGIAQGWFDDMAALAALPNVSCKLSGLVTEIGKGWSLVQLRPVFAHLLRVFGPDRLIWGSDWPVLTLASDYAGWVAATDALLAGLDSAARSAILGGNAARIYLTTRGKEM